jgi:hypothetical protein
MQGERVTSSPVDERGLAFDRAYALVDAETGKLASAKLPRPWGTLLQMRARVVEDQSPAGRPPVIDVSFGDETTRITGAGDAAAAGVIGGWLGREVCIVAAAPEAASFDEVWVEDMGSADSMYAPVTGEDEDALPVLSVPAALGAPGGTLFDFASLHVVAAASVRSLAAAIAGGSADGRRFRPNLLIETDDAGAYPDNGWSTSVFRIGRSLEAQAIMPTMRCVMVTLAQGDLPLERRVLQTLNRTNRIDIPSMGAYPCLGVYARVIQQGTVAEGDEVAILDA